MVKHVVMFCTKDAEGKTASENAHIIRERAMALVGKIPTLRSLSIGINEKPSDAAKDLVLLSEFDDYAGLEAYAIHPEHLQVLDYIKRVTTERHVVDFTA